MTLTKTEYIVEEVLSDDMTASTPGLRYNDELHRLVDSFHSAMDNLSDAMFSMLAKPIKAVKKEIHFGCTTFNWNSLGIVQTVKYMCFVLAVNGNPKAMFCCRYLQFHK